MLDTLALDPLLLLTLPRGHPAFPQLRDARSHAPLLGDLAPLYALDDDGHVAPFPAGGRDTHNLLSIMGAAYGEAGHDLVPSGYLVFDKEADVGEGDRVLGDRALIGFAVGQVRALARKQLGVDDEIGGQNLIYRIEVRLSACLEQTADQCQVLFSRHRASSSISAN